jgi:hypothetical protein
MRTARRFLLAAAILVMASGGIPGAVHARAWRPTRPVNAGPAIAGPGVAWVERERDGALTLHEAVTRDRRVERFPQPPPDRGAPLAQSAILTGDSTGLAMQLLTTRNTTESPAGDVTVTAQYLTGPFGSALQSLATCDIMPGSVFGEMAPVLGGVAYRQCDGKLRIVLPGEPDRLAGDDVHGVRSAGNFVAWTDGPYNAGAQHSAIVVYDVRAGHVAYRLQPAAVPNPLKSFTLQSDGKVAFSFDPNPADQSLRAVAAWASPSEPRLHQLGLPERRFYALRIAGKRVVYARDVGRSGSSDRVELGIADLEGHGRTLVRDGIVGHFDFDGRRVAFARKACGQLRLELRLARTLRPTRCRRR